MAHVPVYQAGVLAMLLAATAVANATSIDVSSIKAAAEHIRPWLTSVRREFHQYPELMYEEHETNARIRKYLKELGIPVQHPFAKTGLVGRVGKGKPVVALRADMDALPVHEPPGLSFRSSREGLMHACGHDGHMTMLLGAANILKQHEADLHGTVLLVFQPAEEGGAGADVMIKEGAIDGASAAFGIHVMPTVPTGKIALRGGTIMAGSLTFQFMVEGRGGHAAMPHLNIDPVPAAAALIQALQTLVSRETSPLGSAVLSITQLQGSDANNIIPDRVILRGTLRALTHEHMMYLKERIEQAVPAAVSAYKCNGTVDWQLDQHPYYPPTVNDPAAAEFVRQVGSEVLGADNVLETEPIMPAEDFGFFTRAVPGAFIFVGIRNETLGSVHNLHSTNFTLDENALPIGAALHASVAMEYLAQGFVGGKTAPSKPGKDEL